MTTTTVRAESRTEMEREVCDCLAATDRYVAAWIGEVDLARNRVVSRTSAGDDADRFVEFGVNLDNASDPTMRTAVAPATVNPIRSTTAMTDD